MPTFTAIDFEAATRRPDSACVVGLVRVERKRIVRRISRRGPRDVYLVNGRSMRYRGGACRQGRRTRPSYYPDGVVPVTPWGDGPVDPRGVTIGTLAELRRTRRGLAREGRDLWRSASYERSSEQRRRRR